MNNLNLKFFFLCEEEDHGTDEGKEGMLGYAWNGFYKVASSLGWSWL